jgi:hypothetical protein
MSHQPLRWVLPWRDLAIVGPAGELLALPDGWQSDSVEIVDGAACYWKARKWTGERYAEIVAGSCEELVEIAYVIEGNVHPN